jgi:hypothetical protein
MGSRAGARRIVYRITRRARMHGYAQEMGMQRAACDMEHGTSFAGRQRQSRDVSGSGRGGLEQHAFDGSNNVTMADSGWW